MVKNYVLDTNVLLHDPHALFSFQDNHVYIPMPVLEELDRFKKSPGALGANLSLIHISEPTRPY